MKNHHMIVFLFSLFLIMSLGSFVSCNEETKVYIVYLGEHNGDKTLKEIEDHYFSFLHSVKGTTTSKEDVRASLVHSYKNVINGFSAVLTPQEVDMISGTNMNMRHLNYPSLAIPNLNDTVTARRRLTNVGASKSIYFASAKPPLGFSIEISPPVLPFNHVGSKRTFTITVKAHRDMMDRIPKDQYVFGWYSWNDGIHNVRSPIAVKLA
ncbi:hypothetical protein MTR67_009109 [Solanum verrucosum]|uniref:Inhibitor I9 domain-containing protein n=1 Tax=Solanum verrucosum TaxID=315347 RepID=A0AAF0Q975_SOLVR|nr:hypothetical protein MTR67_009109 [Solanum verrucosum]